MAVKLVDKTGEREFWFPIKPRVIVGRAYSDVNLGSPEPHYQTVSKQHALFEREKEGQYNVTDLGSTNGTYVGKDKINGEKITLNNGDKIALGSLVLTFEEQ